MSEIRTWPGWECVRQLGVGSFGKVYEIQRIENGKIYKAALKVISIPQNHTELENAFSEGMDLESVTKYFRSVVSDITNEVALMSDLKGYTNIVSYEDHMVVEHQGEIGWDILIRMELLTPLQKWINSNPMTEFDVIRLGCDMCRALDLCHQKKIIHRDIKPQNIFVNSTGDFKLGDFGIARIVERTGSVLSQKGTYTYMAPEVFQGQHYNETADIYSLGIVLYRFLNQNRTPFLPIGELEYADRQEALEKRMNGAVIPAPKYGSETLKQVVLMALQYEPGRRFQSAAAMRSALKRCSMGNEQNESGQAAGGMQSAPTVRVRQPENTPKKESKKNIPVIIFAGLLIVVGVVVLSAVGIGALQKGETKENNCMDIEKYAWGTSVEKIFNENVTDDMVLGYDYDEGYYDDGTIHEFIFETELMGYEMFIFYEFDYYGGLISTSFTMSEDTSDEVYVEAFLDLFNAYKEELGEYDDVTDYSMLRSVINDPAEYAANITEKETLYVSWGLDSVSDDKDFFMWLAGDSGYAELGGMYTCPNYWELDSTSGEDSYGPSDAEVSMEVVLAHPYDDSIYGDSWENFIALCDDRGYYYSIEWVNSVLDVADQVSIAQRAVEEADWTVMFLEPLDEYAFEEVISNAQEEATFVVGMDDSYESTDVNIVSDWNNITYEQWEAMIDDILGNEAT